MSNFVDQSLIASFKEYLLTLQSKVNSMLEEEDGLGKMISETWNYRSGGGGITCTLSNGIHIEKAAVNFSHIYGDKMPATATVRHPHLSGKRFQAIGVSLIIHPRNPYIPTTHANIRLFVNEVDEEIINSNLPYWWFGGGFDLTPFYGFDDDCIHWHKTAKNACDPFGDDIYYKYKKWCDEYFYLPHRNEPRGIGGIFFDDLHREGFDGFDYCLSFVKSIGEHFLLAYRPILSKRKNIIYGDEERDFQLHRRGRYVEFNLLYDRGTLFGLQSQGRTESILLSLPPEVKWTYQYTPKKDSREAELYERFLVIKDWV